MSFDVLRNLKHRNRKKKLNKKKNKKKNKRENVKKKEVVTSNTMKVEYETIYCGLDEKFIPFKGDEKCLVCEESAVFVSENYLEVDICYNNGGGCDVTELGFCTSYYKQHIMKVNSDRNNKELQIIYDFSY
jgi:hypothetical protein